MTLTKFLPTTLELESIDQTLMLLCLALRYVKSAEKPSGSLGWSLSLPVSVA